MRVGLLGFGRTGKTVAEVLLKSSQVRLQWVLRKSEVLEHRSVPEFLGITSEEPGLIYSVDKIGLEEFLDQNPVDFIVDFSSSKSIHEYGPLASQRGIKIISAISNYGTDELSLMRDLAEESLVFWSPNITLGINFLLVMVSNLKKIAPGIDFVIVEEHFKQKPEVSGTAKRIAKSLSIDESEIKSIRVGGIIGRHEVICGFPAQTLRIIHESVSREAFGNGVLFALKNLLDCPKGFYNFEDILNPYIYGSMTQFKSGIYVKN